MFGALFGFVLANIWLIVLATLPLIYLYSTRNFNHWQKTGIKSPHTLPFIGNFFSFTTPAPYLYVEYVKKYGKFFGGFRGNQPSLFISDPEVIKRIMVKDFYIFPNRANRPSKSNKIGSINLVHARGEQWKRVRSMLTPMFTSSKLRKIEPLMRQCTEMMMDSFELATNKSGPEGATLIAHDSMGNFSMDVIAKCAFATETNAHVDVNNPFVTHARNIMWFNLVRFFVSAVLPEFLTKYLRKLKFPFFHNESSEFFINLAKHLISERRDAKRNGTFQHEDMLQLMVNAEFKKDQNYLVENEDSFEAHHVNVGKEDLEAERKILSNIVGSKNLSEYEIIAQAIVFFLAGYDTTASTLSYCLFEMAVNPNIQQRLYQEIQQSKERDPILSYQTIQNLPYLDAVISETLRKYPPAHLTSRECAAKEYYIPEIGYTMKKGETVTFPIYAIHHNEEFHREPERFNPDRFIPENRHQIIPYTYIPFGGGPRNCIGMRFALAEIKLGLVNMIDRFVIIRTPKTPDQLKIVLSFPFLKTEPIHIGIKKRRN